MSSAFVSQLYSYSPDCIERQRNERMTGRLNHHEDPLNMFLKTALAMEVGDIWNVQFTNLPLPTCNQASYAGKVYSELIVQTDAELTEALYLSPIANYKSDHDRPLFTAFFSSHSQSPIPSQFEFTRIFMLVYILAVWYTIVPSSSNQCENLHFLSILHYFLHTGIGLSLVGTYSRKNLILQLNSKLGHPPRLKIS